MDSADVGHHQGEPPVDLLERGQRGPHLRAHAVASGILDRGPDRLHLDVDGLHVTGAEPGRGDGEHTAPTAHVEHLVAARHPDLELGEAEPGRGMGPAAEGAARVEPDDQIVGTDPFRRGDPRRDDDEPSTGPPGSRPPAPLVEPGLAVHPVDLDGPPIAEGGVDRVEAR